MTINFRIVEGNKRENNIDFEQLKLDYLDPKCTVAQLLKKHNITLGEYYRQKERIVEETGVPIKPFQGKKSPFIQCKQYITQDPLSKKYRVAKMVKGILKHFGRYNTLQEAVRVRDVLIDHNWDYDYYLKNIKPHYFKEFPLSSRDDVMDDFEKDYLDGMTGRELCEKYGLSRHHYRNLSTSIKHKHGLLKKPMKVRR